MNGYIAYCGLDCEACEARLATVNNDNELRIKVAEKWSKLNGVEITPEMINCSGCRIPGVKTVYCDSLCPIRQCAREKKVETCGSCPEMKSCEKVGAITGNNPDARVRLENAGTMILYTERLILRPWEEKDAESLYEYAKDSRVGPIAGWPIHTSVENSKEIINTVLSVPETYAVCLKENERAIGSIGLMIGDKSNIGLPDSEGEIGYWIGVPYWGRGFIPEAVGEIIRHAFADLHLDTLWCGYFEGNDKSRRVQEKCGFTYHHTNRDIHWKLMDDIRTEHITRLSRDEWKNSFTIRRLSPDERPAALNLAWRVFSEYESPDYSAEGTEEFRKCLHDEKYLSGLHYYGAFDGRKLIGEIAIRAHKKHICFFFVDGGYHRLGIGTRMFRFLLEDFPDEKITLNSSPFGAAFYKAIGFVPTDEEKTVNGIRFTPMEFEDN